MSNSLVHIANLTKSYGDDVVLSIADFALQAGERYAVIGPNGAGKSTLLRILAGTLDPTSGSIDAPSHLKIGYMPQHPFIFDATVRRNVAMATDRGLSRSRRDELVDQALETVGMLDMADARGPQLSGGEAQRVALARLFARSCDLLLLDEPTSAMDVRGTIDVEQALVRFLAQSEATLVLSTHAPAQALRISTHTLFLDEGLLVEHGPTAALIDEPQTQAASDFLSYWRI